jgi:hypothetical protein
VNTHTGYAAKGAGPNGFSRFYQLVFTKGNAQPVKSKPSASLLIRADLLEETNRVPAVSVLQWRCWTPFEVGHCSLGSFRSDLQRPGKQGGRKSTSMALQNSADRGGGILALLVLQWLPQRMCRACSKEHVFTGYKLQVTPL